MSFFDDLPKTYDKVATLANGVKILKKQKMFDSHAYSQQKVGKKNPISKTKLRTKK